MLLYFIEKLALKMGYSSPFFHTQAHFFKSLWSSNLSEICWRWHLARCQAETPVPRNEPKVSEKMGHKRENFTLIVAVLTTGKDCPSASPATKTWPKLWTSRTWRVDCPTFSKQSKDRVPPHPPCPSSQLLGLAGKDCGFPSTSVPSAMEVIGAWDNWTEEKNVCAF